MVHDEEVNIQSDSNLENSLKFRQVFLFFIKYVTDRTDIIILSYRNKGKQKAHKTRNVFLTLSSPSLISPLPKTRQRNQPLTLHFSSKSDLCRATPRSKSPYLNT